MDEIVYTGFGMGRMGGGGEWGQKNFIMLLTFLQNDTGCQWFTCPSWSVSWLFCMYSRCEEQAASEPVIITQEDRTMKNEWYYTGCISPSVLLTRALQPLSALPYTSWSCLTV